MFLVKEKGKGRATSTSLRVLCVFRAFQYVSPDWLPLARLVPHCLGELALAMHYSIDYSDTKPAYRRPLSPPKQQ